MNFLTKTLAAAVMIAAVTNAPAAETFIINGALSNGDFEMTTGSGTGAHWYTETPNWYNASGSEGINFTNDSQTGGSSQAGSRAGMPFQNRKQVNNSGYNVTAAGVPLNLSYDFGRGGGGWDGDESMRTFLFTATAAVDGFLTTTDMTELVSDIYTFPATPQWTQHTSDAFYTTAAADIGKTFYFGMEHNNPAGSDTFPRIDVVTFSAGVPDRFLFEFNAASNPVNGTSEWQPSVDTGAGHVDGKGTEFFTFASTTSSSPVNDLSVPGITASYDVASRGRASYNPTTMMDENDPAFSANSGGQENAIEVWFKPDSLSGGNQIITEFGGSGRGSYISLQNGTLSYHTNTDNGTNTGFVTLDTTLASAEWTQVVTNWNGAAGEYELFVNGASVDSDLSGATPTSFWGGGNAAGLGAVGDSGGTPGDDIAANGPLPAPTVLGDFPLSGEIGIVRYYESVLSSSEVLASYNAIAAAGQAGDFDASGTVGNGDLTLLLDNWGGVPDAGWVSNPPASVGNASLTELLDNWGNDYTGATLSAVPEPCSAILFVGMIGLAGLRRRRLIASA